MRVIGLDVHRDFAVVAFLEDGEICSGGRVRLTRDAVVAFGRQLRPDDEVRRVHRDRRRSVHGGAHNLVPIDSRSPGTRSAWTTSAMARSPLSTSR